MKIYLFRQQLEASARIISALFTTSTLDLPGISRHQADALSTGKLLYPIIFPVQIRQQTYGMSTVSRTDIRQRVGTDKGLFIIQQGWIGRSRTGCQNQQEKQEDFFIGSRTLVCRP